jgi:Questin oxidase-like
MDFRGKAPDSTWLIAARMLRGRGAADNLHPACGFRTAASPAPMSLHTQLDRSLQFDAEYGSKLSSHLPMALTALARLGAGDERLGQFAQRYAMRVGLRPMPPPEAWPAGDAWQGRFGDPRAWPAYRDLFRQWLGFEGAPAVLAQALPALMRGVGAAAFHAQIRTAHAIDSGHEAELAHALAYWACRWFALGALATDGSQRDPAAVLSRMHFDKPKRPLIAERMALVAARPAFRQVAGSFLIDAERPAVTLESLATLAAGLYAQTGHFTVLHLVTSAHAMRVLLPCLDPGDAAAALGHYWLAFAAGHASSGLRGADRKPLPGSAVRACARRRRRGQRR